MSTHVLNGLVVEVQGDGEPVLAVHGLGGSSNVWTPLLEAFSGQKLVRPDLPGSARSPLPEVRLSIDVYVASLAQLMSDLNIGAAHIVAHSMGTIVAQHLAIQHPALVKSLVLFGPLISPPEAGRAGIQARADLARTGLSAVQEIADAIVKAATAAETKRDQPAVLALVRECLMRQSPEGYAQSCEALAQAQPAEIGRITVPTLLVTGDQDSVSPPAHVTVMAERIPGSSLVVLPACGHWTPFEKPQACIEALQDFHARIR